MLPELDETLASYFLLSINSCTYGLMDSASIADDQSPAKKARFEPALYARPLSRSEGGACGSGTVSSSSKAISRSLSTTGTAGPQAGSCGASDTVPSARRLSNSLSVSVSDSCKDDPLSLLQQVRADLNLTSLIAYSCRDTCGMLYIVHIGSVCIQLCCLLHASAETSVLAVLVRPHHMP